MFFVMIVMYKVVFLSIILSLNCGLVGAIEGINCEAIDSEKLHKECDQCLQRCKINSDVDYVICVVVCDAYFNAQRIRGQALKNVGASCNDPINSSLRYQKWCIADLNLKIDEDENSRGM